MVAAVKTESEKGRLDMTPPYSLNFRQTKEAIFQESDLAQQALREGNTELGWSYQKRILTGLSTMKMDPDCEALMVSTTLSYLNLSFTLGKGFSDSAHNLKNAQSAADRIGDLRSRALILLHLGRVYHYTKQRQDALDYFEKGKAEVESLGDEDILNQSADFLGFYFQLKGLFLEALPHFERAARTYEQGSRVLHLNPLGPISLAYCYANLGRFHQAIGTLDYYRRIAAERSDQSLVISMRAVLGMILIMINRKKEALYHLTKASQEAEKTKNELATYFATQHLSYYQLMEGKFQESRDTLSKFVAKRQRAGHVVQYQFPLSIEQLYEFNRLGLKPIPGMNYQKEIKRLTQESNIHLKGVAHRLIAKESILKEGNYEEIEAELKLSEDLLQRSGDPVQLAKTRIELARIELKKNNREGARHYAQKAWKGFSGYEDVFFPESLKQKLLIMESAVHVTQEHNEELVERFMSMINELVPSADLEELMSKTVAALNRFFGAERGGLFWFGENIDNNKPVLKGAQNLTQSEITSDLFKSNLSVIIKAFQRGKPYVAHLEEEQYWPHKASAILCLPFLVAGQPRGILYHDNYYVKDCFDFLGKKILTRLGYLLSAYIDKIYAFSRQLEQSVSDKTNANSHSEHQVFVTKSTLMQTILNKVDRMAVSDGTILILGETGVGKEVTAHRIHHMSPRKEGPFVIVDSTAIADNLFESELFGHEKGAFSGADRRKLGRLELAHGGTLFIDEIGEIPKPLQSKLLRVIQEKTLVRLGGTNTISCDFRLVVATNRNLAAEVASGRFREDLYFRINVLPVTIPPLRERLEDVPLLARLFLNRLGTKNNHPLLELTPEDELRLMNYQWPGNVRELRNIIERAVILSEQGNLELDIPAQKVAVDQFYSDYPTLDEVQRRFIKHTVEKTGGKIGGTGGAAELLGIKRTTLLKRMKKLGVS